MRNKPTMYMEIRRHKIRLYPSCNKTLSALENLQQMGWTCCDDMSLVWGTNSTTMRADLKYLLARHKIRIRPRRRRDKVSDGRRKIGTDTQLLSALLS